MGFLPALTLVFVTLKLVDIITWSWWLVIAPMYPFILFWLLIIIGVVAFGTEKRSSNRRF
jgi:hypothetical protein